MADKRIWFKVDVGYLDNPKVSELVDDSPRAIILHLFCIAYSKQHGTDGIVPMRLAMRRACAEHSDLQKCLDLGLLAVDNSNHLVVHDYLEHQSSAEDDRQRSHKAKRAAAARWADTKDAPSNASSIPPSTAKRTARRNAPSNAERESRERDSAYAGDELALIPAPAQPAPAADTAQTLMADWLDHCQQRPPASVIGQVGKHTKAMLDEGIPADTIRAALARWQQKGLHPSALPSVVNEITNSRPAGTRAQQQQDSLARQLQLAQQLDAQEEAAS